MQSSFLLLPEAPAPARWRGRPVRSRYSHGVSSAHARIEDDIEATFAAGGVDALQRVYDAYGRLVFSLCRRSLGNETAADVTQEVFVAAWQARHQFDRSRGSLAGWLMGIARNKVVDNLRAQSRRPVTTNDPTPVDAPVSAKAVDDLADRLLLAEALAELPDRSKRVIELAFFEDLTHPEIAARCDLPLGTVKSDIRRGLARMRRHLERER
jgi:RNA polymerase sigma factor (sigma-70 family)